MKRTTLLPAVIAATLLSCHGGTTLAQSQPPSPTLPTGPLAGDQDLSPFYRWTQPLPPQPGRMLREEPMPAQPEVTAAGLAKRILYTSTDLRWHAGIVPVSGTIYLPKGEPPPGGWPLVAWAHGTLGVADSCAPSWAGHKPRDAAYINHWLGAGFAVVATDYQGLGGPGPHPYLIWEAEGRSVLDSVRAALATYPDKLARKVFITGQSQGSGAALGATRIAPSYAPDVPLLATVATGLVSTFPSPANTVPQRSRPAQLRYVVLTMVGGALPDGAPSADALATDKGKVLLAAARTGCSGDVYKAARRDGVTADNAFVEPFDKIQAQLTPVTDMLPVQLPVPAMLGTGLADTTLVPRRQYMAVSALCAAGSDIVWKTYPGATHNGGLNASFPDALAFVQAVLAGKSPASTCNALAQPGDPEARAAGIPFNN